MLLGDLASQRERLQAASVPPPLLTVDPIAIPTATEPSRRPSKARIQTLEQIAGQNLLAAEEARAAVAERQHRLELETAARVQAEIRIDVLTRDVHRLQDEDGQRLAQARAQALYTARETVAGELADMTSELDKLRAALSDQDELLKEYRDRLRDEQETRLGLEGELKDARGARSRRTTVESLVDASAEPVARDEQLELLGREIDAMTARIETMKTNAAAAAEDAAERIGELEAKLEDAEGRARDAERSQGKLRREASDAGKGRRAAEDALREATAERDELYTRVEQAEQALDLARVEASEQRDRATAACDELEAARAELEAARSAIEAAQNRGQAPEPQGLRRSAMAELSAIAFTSVDDLRPRWR
jgi:chromosome segregation ATPase